MKRLLALLLTLSLAFSLCLSASAGGPSTELPMDPLEPDYPIDENLKFAMASFSLDSKILFSCFVDSAVLEGYDSWYVEFYNMDSVDSRVTVFGTDYGTPYSNMYYFQLPVYVCQMTDRFNATIYAVKDGVTYMGQSVVSSVEQFVLQLLPRVSAKQQVLMANMLEYGAKMQKYFNYRVGCLANDELGEYESLVIREIPAAENIYSSTDYGITDVKITARAMALSSILEMQYALYYSDSINPADTYVEFLVDDTSFRVEGADLVASGKSRVAIVENILPTQADSPIRITVRDAATDEALSETYTDSIASAVAVWQSADGVDANLLDAINAMLNYYRAAADMFNG